MFALGNDLARVLRWGPGYTGGEDPLNLLRDVIDAEEIKLDRYLKSIKLKVYIFVKADLLWIPIILLAKCEKLFCLFLTT